MYRVSSLCHFLSASILTTFHCGSHLVEENILPVPSLSSEILEVAVLADAMLETQLLPELTTNCSTISPCVLVGCCLPRVVGVEE